MGLAFGDRAGPATPGWGPVGWRADPTQTNRRPPTMFPDLAFAARLGASNLAPLCWDASQHCALTRESPSRSKWNKSRYMHIFLDIDFAQRPRCCASYNVRNGGANWPTYGYARVSTRTGLWMPS